MSSIGIGDGEPLNESSESEERVGLLLRSRLMSWAVIEAEGMSKLENVRDR